MVPLPSDFAFGPLPYDIMVQGELLATDMTTATKEKAPQPAVFMLGLPPYDVTVQGQTPAAM